VFRMILNALRPGVGIRATPRHALIRNTVRSRHFSKEQADLAEYENVPPRNPARILNRIRKVVDSAEYSLYHSPKYAIRRKYKAIVTGGGPAGLAAVGNLLEQKKEPILWIDYKYDGGRLSSHYREVPRCALTDGRVEVSNKPPSNTKVKRFMDYAEGVEAFRKISETAKQPNVYTELKSMDQEKTCDIGRAADLCRFLAQGLMDSGKVDTLNAKVFEARKSSKVCCTQSILSNKPLNSVGMGGQSEQQKPQWDQFGNTSSMHWEFSA
jgi:hypothetical protein